MEALGTTLPVFIGLTVMLMGGTACLTGQALARNWRPVWQTLPYALLLGLGDRFLTYALFDGELLNPLGYVVDTAIILAIGLLAYRLTRVHRMVSQYPWLYRRAGPFAWREIEN